MTYQNGAYLQGMMGLLNVSDSYCIVMVIECVVLVCVLS